MSYTNQHEGMIFFKGSQRRIPVPEVDNEPPRATAGRDTTMVADLTCSAMNREPKSMSAEI